MSTFKLDYNSSRNRRIKSGVMIVATSIAALIATAPLILILFHLVKAGAGAINLDFFTQTPAPVGQAGGGMANAIYGTLTLISIAALVGLPIGIGASLYLAENPSSRLAGVVRYLSDVLNGLPSIVMGIFAWELIVRPMGGFSAIAGGIALGTMMIPLVTRTSEEMLKLVPHSLYEASLALGYPKWRASLSVVLRTALPGIVTGALVAIARISGETAPLLFTALGNQFWSTSLFSPIAALPLQIYTYAISPFEEWHTQAWAGSLVLITLVLIISILARTITNRQRSYSE